MCKNCRAKISLEELSSNLTNVATGAGDLSTSMNTVATAVEEMSLSLSEVAKNCADDAQMSGQAMKRPVWRRLKRRLA